MTPDSCAWCGGPIPDGRLGKLASTCSAACYRLLHDDADAPGRPQERGGGWPRWMEVEKPFAAQEVSGPLG